NIDGVTIGFDIECAVRGELQKIQAGEIACGVVEEHVFAARVAGVDAVGIFRSVPAIDGGVVLHSGIATVPGGFGNLAHHFFGFVSGDDCAVANRLGGEIGVADNGVHEVVGDAHGVVRVLEKDGRVGVGIGMRSVVALRDERVGFGFFFLFALDEVDDVGMVDVENDHLGGATSFASRLDDSGESVETFHEAERAAGGASATEAFGLRAQRRKIGSSA